MKLCQAILFVISVMFMTGMASPMRGHRQSNRLSWDAEEGLKRLYPDGFRSRHRPHRHPMEEDPFFLEASSSATTKITPPPKVRIWNTKTGEIEQYDAEKHLEFPDDVTSNTPSPSLGGRLTDRLPAEAYIARHNEKTLQQGANHILKKSGGIVDEKGYLYTSDQATKHQWMPEVWEHTVGEHGSFNLLPSSKYPKMTTVKKTFKEHQPTSLTAPSQEDHTPPNQSQKE